VITIVANDEDFTVLICKFTASYCFRKKARLSCQISMELIQLRHLECFLETKKKIPT
jgi:hypothetical protein